MMATTTPATFYLGQPVPWYEAPGRIAQVEELLRRNVQILWRDDRGRLRRRRINAAALQERVRDEPFLVHVPDNPYGRAIVAGRKTFNHE